jgi:hypothetical protein
MMMIVIGTGVIVAAAQRRTVNAPGTTNPASTADHIRIYGNSVFEEQGPTDAVTGSVPASATLIIGSKRQVLSAFQSPKDSGQSDYRTTTVSRLKQVGARVITTAKGTYSVDLNKGEDTLCLVDSQVSESAGSGNTTTYRLPTNTCSQLTTAKQSVEINISQIGFGADQLECAGKHDCAAVPIPE